LYKETRQVSENMPQIKSEGEEAPEKTAVDRVRLTRVFTL
jgi:hypothetical protein